MTVNFLRVSRVHQAGVDVMVADFARICQDVVKDPRSALALVDISVCLVKVCILRLRRVAVFAERDVHIVRFVYKVADGSIVCRVRACHLEAETLYPRDFDVDLAAGYVGSPSVFAVYSGVYVPNRVGRAVLNSIDIQPESSVREIGFIPGRAGYRGRVVGPHAIVPGVGLVVVEADCNILVDFCTETNVGRKPVKLVAYDEVLVVEIAGGNEVADIVCGAGHIDGIILVYAGSCDEAVPVDLVVASESFEGEVGHPVKRVSGHTSCIHELDVLVSVSHVRPEIRP